MPTTRSLHRGEEDVDDIGRSSFPTGNFTSRGKRASRGGEGIQGGRGHHGVHVRQSLMASATFKLRMYQESHLFINSPY